MSEFERLLDTGRNPAARALLSSALVDTPTASAFERTAMTLGVSGVGIALSGAAHGAVVTAASGASAGSKGALVVGKWFLVGLLSGGALSGTAVFTTRALDTPSTALAAPATEARAPAFGARNSVRAAEPIPEVTAPDSPVNPVVAAPVRAAMRARSAPVKEAALAEASPAPLAASATPDPESRLRVEVEMIDAARAALAARDSTTSLAILNRYAAEVTTHVLDTEARLLRIDALIQSGDRGSAARIAEAYLRDHPNDAHAARLRALLSGTPQTTR
jgi:hypothetical protein